MPGIPSERIAFVHIPKTAGRSVVHAFEHALGADRCAAFVPVIDEAAFFGKRFVSGHVQLSEIIPDAFAFSFLREPINQLASHLRWLDRYNDGVFWEEVIPFSDSTRETIRRVGQTDFACPRSLAAFFEWLPEHCHVRLRNVQCEVLAARRDRLAYTDPRAMAEAAIAALARLQFVGLAESLDADLGRLFQVLELPEPPQVTRQNLLSSRRYVTLADPAIRRVLARQVAADLRLYHHVLAQRPQPWRGRLHGRLRPIYYAWRG